MAGKALTELRFPECALLELYWLSCVLADYDTQSGFNFRKLTLPDWFPLPFGFKHEEMIDKQFLDLKGGRIRLPVVWNEVDKLFWFQRDIFAQLCPPEQREQCFQEYPWNRDFVLVLPSDHPIHKFVGWGRPRKALPNGEVLLPHKAIGDTVAPDQYDICPAKPVAPSKCNRDNCGGTPIWYDEDKIYKCMMCGRAVMSYNSG